MADNPSDGSRQPDDINYWLRSVRPATPADENWTGSAAADELLTSVHRRLGIPETAKTTAAKTTTTKATALGRGHRRSWWAAGAGLAAAAVLAALVVPGWNGNATKNENAIPNPRQQQQRQQQFTIRPAALLLNNYSSCAQLLTDLRSHTAASVTPYGLPGVFGGYTVGRGLALAPIPNAAAQAADSGKAAASAGGADSSATSDTNVQEAGVDEPDIVKTDNGRLISITGGMLRIVDAASKRITGSLDLSIYAGWQGAQLLVTGDHALVVLGNQTAGVIYDMGPRLGLVPNNRSSYLFVDLAGQPKVTG